ncbi:MAG: hypothetical protein AAF234_02070 [Pseudomonadota bacterium]
MELDRVCQDWKQDLLLPVDDQQANACLQAFAQRFNYWLGWPDFTSRVARNLGQNVDVDIISIDQWKPIRKQFLDGIRSMHPDLVGHPVFFLSIHQEGVVTQGSRTSQPTYSSGFVDGAEYYCAFDCGDVDFFVSQRADPIVEPDWFYSEEVVSLHEFQTNDKYMHSVYSFTTDLALSIIEKYRSGLPSMMPPEPPAETPPKKGRGT